jgi:hypothetical protein
MNQTTVHDLQHRVSQYLSNACTLDEFRDWFDDETWGLAAESDSPARRIAGEIELRLAEFTNGHRTEDDLRYHFESLLPKADKTEFHVAITRAEPLVEMISS